jgi:hypothetical protein
MLKLDPLRLDRTLARYAGQHSRFETLLARGAAAEHAFELRPPELDAELLHELRDAGDRDPLAQPLARWASFLLLEHALVEPEVRASEALHLATHQLDRPQRGELTLAEMRRCALLDVPRREGWLAALEARAQRLQAARFELFERRAERALALGVTADSALSALPGAVERCLERTQDAYAELDIRSLARLFELGLGRDVPGSFPSRLSPRVLGELLHEGNWLSGLEPRLERLPEAWGASSFLRAVRAFGSALHDAGASTRQPFCVAREPHGLRSALFGNLFALLLLNPAFAARRLDIGRGRFEEYRRALGAVVLLAVRVDCVRAQLADASPLGARSYRDAFNERIPATFGFELPPGLAGVLWVDARAPRRFAALLAAFAKNAELIQAHDEDWFRNPRAAEELRAELESAPPLVYPKEQLELGLELLCRTLNESA